MDDLPPFGDLEESEGATVFTTSVSEKHALRQRILNLEEKVRGMVERDAECLKVIFKLRAAEQRAEQLQSDLVEMRVDRDVEALVKSHSIDPGQYQEDQISLARYILGIYAPIGLSDGDLDKLALASVKQWQLPDK